MAEKTNKRAAEFDSWERAGKISKFNMENRGRNSAPAVSLNHYAASQHADLFDDVATSYDDFQLPNFVSTPVDSSKQRHMTMPQASKHDANKSGHAAPAFMQANSGTPEDIRGMNLGQMRRNLHMSQIASSSSLRMNDSISSAQSPLPTSTPLNTGPIRAPNSSDCCDPLPSSPPQYRTTRLHVQSPGLDAQNFSAQHDIQSMAKDELSGISDDGNVSPDFSMQGPHDEDELPSSYVDRFSGGQSDFLLPDLFEDGTSDNHTDATSADPSLPFSTSSQRFDSSSSQGVMTASATSPLAHYVHAASDTRSVASSHPIQQHRERKNESIGTSGSSNQVLFDMQSTPTNIFKHHNEHHYPNTEPRKSSIQNSSASSTFQPYAGHHGGASARPLLSSDVDCDNFNSLPGGVSMSSRRGPRQSLPFSSDTSAGATASYTPPTEIYHTTDSSFEVLGAEASDAQMLPPASSDAPYRGDIASEYSSRYRRNVLEHLSASDVNRDHHAFYGPSASVPHTAGMNMFTFDPHRRAEESRATSGVGMLSTPKTSAHSATLMVPQSASKVEMVRFHGGEHFRQWLDFKRMEYDPFLKCTKHDICLARANLKKEYILSGCYYKLESAESEGASPKARTNSPRSRSGKGKGRAGLLTHKLHLWQAVNKHKQPYRREESVQESAIGLANLCQLHVTRALEQRALPKRPLLSPDIATSSVTPPIVRILESKRFYCGSFFTRQGACQVADCILIVFPKNHRGDVRLQLKVWDEHLQDNNKKCDIKAHLLSYVCWLYGISDQSGESLGQWPPNLTGACSFGRNSKPGDDHNEFLCINPFHYVKDVEHEKRLERNVHQRVSCCTKDLPCLEGEKPNRRTNNCQCYCLKCRFPGPM
eukprot:m.1455503 g.1455503  ORF g.1455503 m.1455503 type:complete len:876 (-) comp25120_c0_seq42:1822-4449(-)